ncbi:MAG: FtsQ-type POTRA domain-containing protein, partial [Gemmatimonadetes bacterium]|nr:FtsQ-type POTRA domain-containing protein [Gemmatimonadota bacterium]
QRCDWSSCSSDLGLLLAVAGSLGYTGVRAFPELRIFRVQTIEATGIRRLTVEMVWEAAGVDSTTSVWTSAALLEERLERHPLVATARVERSPPSTLVVAIEEAVPVALVASPLVEPVDASGAVLPIDPRAPLLDLPLISALDGANAAEGAAGTDARAAVRTLARDLHQLGEVAPEVLSVLSEARLVGSDATLLLGDEGLRVRYTPPLPEDRLLEAVVAMNDADARFPDRTATEIDLRFADQVVVRTTPMPPAEEDEDAQ